MKIKNKIEFLSFNDGAVVFFNIDDYGKPVQKGRIRCFFGDKTVGIKRYFAARQNDIEINKVIQIHQNQKITTENKAVINKTVYDIVQVQHLDDTNPKSTVLSLSQRGLYEGEFTNV